MKYLFILGRNPKLSIEEIKSFFVRVENKIIDLKIKENSALVELENPLDAETVDLLGGTIAIGIIICNIKDIDRKEIYLGEKNNFAYALWDFSKYTEDISEYLKKRFRKEKLKATEKKFRESMNMQNGEMEKSLSSKVDEEYFVYEDFFGKIVQRCNYRKIEERDMKKPIRRESLSISPRLAKIMINLAEIKEGEILLDAFCGIGVVLQEALLQDIKVIGIDNDKNAIAGAKENLKWFKFPEDNYKLINEDSSKARIKDVNGMASEPDFGETLKKIPPNEIAESMIKRYENIIINVLRNLNKSIKGKIVFTSPLIKTNTKRVECNVKRIAASIGRKIKEEFPIPEFRENQIVGREIVVLEN